MAAEKAPYAIGLTGGIGSGKSTVAALFAARGATIVDTDAIAHQLTAAGGAAMPELIAAFGPVCATPQGALDRDKMRALVFSDPGAKQRLEAILHPMIREVAGFLAADATGAYTIFVVPLLIEAGGWNERVDRILVVDCPEQVQIARVMQRNGLPEAQVRAIMSAQVSREQRLAAADDVIENADGLAALEPQITRLHDLYLAFSKRMATIPSERL